MDLNNKKVVVVGLGKSGIAALDLLKKMNADVCLYDGNTNIDKSQYDVPTFLGDYPEDEFSKLDLAVFSPGVPLDIPIALFFKEKNVPIIGEIELAYYYEKGEVVAITGTNGKTTTTTLVGEIMAAHNANTFVVGNIGNPYTTAVTDTTTDSVTVAEISSFQLETIDTFKPKASAILNITEDHLNRHKTMECYIDMKFKVAMNQDENDLCVLNYEDEILRDKSGLVPCKVEYFSSKQPVECGLYQNENHDIVDANTKEVILNMKEVKILGDHNCENIMAAIMLTRHMGVPMDTIVSACKNFNAVEHRIEFVKNVNGVDYYNDSKGTNPDAAIKAVSSMNRPTVLIAGGYDKQNEFDEWIQSFDGKVKKMFIMGETKDKIAQAAKDNGFNDFEFVESLSEAVDKSAQVAVDGDAVLLSPACASWDMFKSYEQRGEMFKEFVNKL